VTSDGFLDYPGSTLLRCAPKQLYISIKNRRVILNEDNHTAIEEGAYYAR
jgi:hypothetical protein